MITKEILEGKLNLYRQSKQQALAALEKVKADINAYNGAIETCEDLLKLNEELEAVQSIKIELKPEAEKEVKTT